jgi:hypothetical protein
LNNHKKEKLFESSMDKARSIPDDDCWPHESISHAYCVRSQTDQDKKYLATWYHKNFMVCECPWSIRGNTFKHTIKVEWLYFLSKGLEPSLDQNAEPNIFDYAAPDAFNYSPEIIMEISMIDENVDMTHVAIGIVGQDDEALRLAREELLGYLDVL